MIRRRTHATSRLSRWSLFLAALLVLPGQVGAFLHLATTSHVVCADHAEAVDLGDDCGDVAAGQPESHGDREQNDPAHENHTDHHCVALQLWSHAFRSADAPILTTASPRTATEANAPAFELRSPRLPTWRLAPKHSPPTG